jgi:hypothetical protein
MWYVFFTAVVSFRRIVFGESILPNRLRHRRSTFNYDRDTLGYSVPFADAVQLRNWAVRPKDTVLPLGEIARGILDQEENPNASGVG